MDYYEAYVRLEMGAIDDVDAAVFSGDIFHDEENRKRFRKMLERWTKEMDALDASGFGLNP
jgi:DNA repair exonuclease SbcCD nuclease subunit